MHRLRPHNFQDRPCLNLYFFKLHTIVEANVLNIAPIYIHSCLHSFIDKVFMITSCPTLAFCLLLLLSYCIFFLANLSYSILSYISSQCLSMSLRSLFFQVTYNCWVKRFKYCTYLHSFMLAFAYYAYLYFVLFYIVKVATV